LLHGAYMSLEGPMRELIGELSKTHQVIAPELQGHGRTTDAKRDITYEGMADDVYALIRHLKIDSVDIVGYSMGSGIAMQLAIRYPQAVKKMTLMSASYSDTGVQPILMQVMPQLTPALFEGSVYKKIYDSLAPEKKNFPVLVEKLKKLDLQPFNWEQGYRKLGHPLFLVFGDADVVTIEHITDMFRKRGGGVFGDLQPMPNVQLAIIPHTTHQAVLERLSWITPMIKEFLNKK
jgi:pimeloyl-ACP methyl ester carboxylesterase